MRARMNRKILLSYLKSMVRVVPQSNSIMELMGFMIECNEDEGVVYITVSNLETTMQVLRRAEALLLPLECFSA